MVDYSQSQLGIRGRPLSAGRDGIRAAGGVAAGHGQRLRELPGRVGGNSAVGCRKGGDGIDAAIGCRSGALHR